MFTWFLTDQPVRDWGSAAKSNTARFGKFHRAMLEEGIWLPPAQFEAAFLSAAHSMDDISQTVEAARKAFATIKG
jgi:glutamate-1-semialdehyde 2,1-aminomutase